MLEPVTNPGARELRKFSLMFFAFFAGIWGLVIPLLIMRRPPLLWAIILGGVVGLWGLIAPKTTWPLYLVWMKIGGILGWINTRIILSVFYYLVVTPFAIAFKLMGKDPMRRRFDSSASTYRIPSRRNEPSHMEKPF